MKIKIEEITNGWLVIFEAMPSASDPMAQRHDSRPIFADTREAVCGLIAERVLGMGGKQS